MKQGRWLLCVAVAAICGFTVFAAEEAAEQEIDRDFPPHVVKTVPENLAKEVDVALREIRVTFDRPMKQEKAWSWMIHRNLGVYPGVRTRGGAGPHWEEDGRTCVLPVALAPNTVYAVGANSVRNTGFRDTEDKIAVPYVWVFKTGGRQ